MPDYTNQTCLTAQQTKPCSSACLTKQAILVATPHETSLSCKFNVFQHINPYKTWMEKHSSICKLKGLVCDKNQISRSTIIGFQGIWGPCPGTQQCLLATSDPDPTSLTPRQETNSPAMEGARNSFFNFSLPNLHTHRSFCQYTNFSLPHLHVHKPGHQDTNFSLRNLHTHKPGHQEKLLTAKPAHTNPVIETQTSHCQTCTHTHTHTNPAVKSQTSHCQTCTHTNPAVKTQTSHC